MLTLLNFIYRLISATILIQVGIDLATWLALFYLIFGIIIVILIVRHTILKNVYLVSAMIFNGFLILGILITIIWNMVISGILGVFFFTGYLVLSLIELRMIPHTHSERLAEVSRTQINPKPDLFAIWNTFSVK